MKKGEWLPISYDVLDYITCKKAASHKAIVTDGDDIAFDFDVSTCTFYTDQYVYHDKNKTEIRALPHWFGEGFYRAHIDSKAFINTDYESLGVRNRYDLRIGLSYALADETLKAIE